MLLARSELLLLGISALTMQVQSLKHYYPRGDNATTPESANSTMPSNSTIPTDASGMPMLQAYVCDKDGGDMCHYVNTVPGDCRGLTTTL